MLQAESAPGAQTMQHPQAPSRESMELMALEHRREELRTQLKSVSGRRALLDMQIRDADGSARGELVERARQLDARAISIQNQLDVADDRVLGLLSRGVTYPQLNIPNLPPLLEGPGIQGIQVPGVPGFGPPDPFDSQWGELFGGMLAMQGLTFVLLGVVLWRSFRRHVSTRLASDDANRLEQLQRSVDVMAVEVERISESQRFTAKLLNEQVAEPLRVGKDAERVR
jgi:hypothetical protein